MINIPFLVAISLLFPVRLIPFFIVKVLPFQRGVLRLCEGGRGYPSRYPVAPPDRMPLLLFSDVFHLSVVVKNIVTGYKANIMSNGLPRFCFGKVENRVVAILLFVEIRVNYPLELHFAP